MTSKPLLRIHILVDSYFCFLFCFLQKQNKNQERGNLKLPRQHITN